jgi:membrane-associated phospholipid phosphatase
LFPPDLQMTADPATLEVEAMGAPDTESQRRRWRPTRLQISLFVWAGLASYLIFKWHLTTDRTHLFIIIGSLLVAAGAGRLDHVARLVRDWAPLFVVLWGYDLLRGQADEWGLSTHVTPQINADRFMFGTVPTVWLQHAMFTPGRPHLWDYALFFVYLTHFFLVIIVAALLWKFAYHRFHRFAAMFVGLSFAAFVTYAFFPAAPPWLASQSHNLPPTAKIVDEVWVHLGLHNGASILSARGTYANPVAAIPSLHAAFPLLLMFFFWQSAGRWRWLLVLYPLAMALALVYTGEHYVIDIFLGWIYATVVYVFGLWVAAAWERRQARKAPVVPLSVAAPEPALSGASLSSRR